MRNHNHIADAVAAFASAFKERDFDQAAAFLADDVAFRSPVLETPWRTKDVVSRLGPAMVSILDDLQFDAPALAGRRGVLSFTGTCDGVALEGTQVIDLDDNGKVADMAILIRPLPALLAVARAMGAAVDPALLAGHR
jgi:hypothetical protein